MGDYDLNSPGPRNFQHIVQAIAQKVVAPGVVVFGDGKDGARDLTFDGKMDFPSASSPWNGYLVVGCKHRQRPTNDLTKDGDWAIAQLKTDLKKYLDPKRKLRKPEYYILATNVVLSGVAGTGGRDRCTFTFKSYKSKLRLKGYSVWDQNDIRAFLDGNLDIRQAYAHLITPGDVMAKQSHAVAECSKKLDELLREQPASSSRYENQAGDESGFVSIANAILRLTDVIQSKESLVSEQPSREVRIRDVATPIDLSPPPPLNCTSSRADAVRLLKGMCPPGRWLSLRGESGVGKTQLAMLLGRELADRTIWIRLKEQDGASAVEKIDTGLQTIIGPGDARIFEEWFRAACTAITNHTLIVLDDLPACRTDTLLASRLLALSRAIVGTKVRVVSTTNHDVASALGGLLGGNLTQVECPAFTDAEVSNLLNAFGAPSLFNTTPRAQFLNMMTRGHPVLLVAAIRYLENNGWKFRDLEIDNLVRGKHTDALIAETLDRVITTVADPDTRELLYRLRLVMGSFTLEVVDTVASVTPAIGRAVERLHTLTGLWVQHETDKRLCLSPLLGSIPESNVPRDVRLATHRALGERIMKQRVVGPWELSLAISHFLRAEVPNQAAMLLLRGLECILDEGAVGHARVLLLLWADLPLPEDVDLKLKVLLRIRQIAALDLAELPIDYAMADLVRLEPLLSDSETWTLMGIVATAALLRAPFDFKFVVRALVRLVNTRRKWPKVDSKPIKFPPGLTPAALLWLVVNRIKTREDQQAWIAGVGQLHPRDRSALFGWQDTQSTCSILAGRLWIAEHEKLETDRNWSAVLDALDELVTAADVWEQPFLRANAIRAKMVVFCDYQDNVDAALTLASVETAARHKDGADGVILYAFAGWQSYLHGRKEEARTWLSKALPHIECVGAPTQMLSLLHAACAFGDVEACLGLEYAERAYRVSGQIIHLALGLKVELCGELGIARWLSGDAKGTFSCFDEAAQLLMDCAEHDRVWKGLCVLLGHACTYIAQCVRTNKPHAIFGDGSQWTAPQRGFFLRNSDHVADLYSDPHGPALMLQLELFADAIGDEASVIKWAERGITASESANVPILRAHCARVAIVAKTVSGRINDAIELAFEAERIFVAATSLTSSDDHNPLTPFDVGEVLANTGMAAAQQIDRQGVIVAGLVLLFDLAMKRISSSSNVSVLANNTIPLILGKVYDKSENTYASQVCDALASVFVDNRDANELNRMGNESGNWLVRVITYLGCSLDPNVTLRDACKSQVVALSAAARATQSIIGMERRMVFPLIATYWSRVLARQRFSFSCPQVIERDLNAAGALSPDVGVRAILQSISSGLGIRVPDFTREWLYAGDNNPEFRNTRRAP